MKHKNLLIKGTAFYLTLTLLLSGGLPPVAPAARVLAQGTPPRGDITSDGVVDGRDALKIMRVVEGYETATAEEIARGDVYPLPGTSGRLVVLTVHDNATARQRVRQTGADAFVVKGASLATLVEAIAEA